MSSSLLRLSALIFIVCACTPRIILGPTGNPGTENSPQVETANPASTFCQQNGGTLQMRRGISGEIGYCVFSNISECEEWSFYRGQCQPGDNPYRP